MLTWLAGENPSLVLQFAFGLATALMFAIGCMLRIGG